jgi:glycosyltransferase involved in cell wall biosynthesis
VCFSGFFFTCYLHFLKKEGDPFESDFLRILINIIYGYFRCHTLYNEQESLEELAEWIERVLHENSFSYEIIFIDDGSTDRSWEIIENLASDNESVRAMRFRRNYGKSAALYSGFGVAQGEVVITMDADMQDDPDEIPELYNMVIKKGYDLVSGWKKDRMTRRAKKFPADFSITLPGLLPGIRLMILIAG